MGTVPFQVTDFEGLLATLRAGGVDFIVVGDMAAVIHGSPRLTSHLDVVYSRRPANISRVVTTLAPLQPYPRGAPPRLPFRLDEGTVGRGLNFVLNTSFGALDLLGEVVGGGRYEDLLPDTISVTLFGMDCCCLNLDRLIELKRAAGLPSELGFIAELEVLREERDRL
jgi:hypothetical protein